MRISDWSSDVCSSDLDEGRLPGHLSAGAEARFRRPDVQEHEGRRRPARARGRVAGDEPRELVDRLLRAVARASQGAYAQPGQVRLGYAARADGRSGGRRRLLRPYLALLGQTGPPDRKSVSEGKSGSDS